jgi:hypothetical protein
MSEIQLFDVHGSGWRFGVADNGRSFAVATDAAKTFDYRDAANALRQVEDDEKGTQIVSTPGGPQEMWVIYEDGKALREFLYAEHLLIRGGSSHNEPYARHVQSGHFELKTTLVEIDPDRPAQAKSTTYVTPKGEALIWRRLHEAGYVRSREMPPAQLELLSI